MDNNADIEYALVEEQYLNKCAKHNIGDVVYFQDDNHEMAIGIIHERTVLTMNSIRRGNPYSFKTIGYKIITPNNIVIATEAKVTSASQYIFRRYIKSHQQAK